MSETDRRNLQTQLAALGLSVSEEAQNRLLWFAEELLRWNRRINLTAITEPEEVINKHLIDSLTLLPLLADDERLLDMGSGGGFPGLPVKIIKPDLQLVSVDASAKKISFQKHIARHLNLTHCTLLPMRVEEVPNWPGIERGFATVVSRAFASIETIIRLGTPCLAEKGRIVAMKGPEGEKELEQAGRWLKELDLLCIDIKKFRLPSSNAERMLVSLMKRQAKEKA